MLIYFFTVKAGESVISRKSTEFSYTSQGVPTTLDIADAINEGTYSPKSKSVSVFPHNLLLPKGLFIFLFILMQSRYLQLIQ